MNDSPSLIALVATLGVLWWAAWADFRTFRIPNALCVSGAVLGLLIHGWDSGSAGLWQSLIGLGLGMALLLPGYLFMSTGAGDVKLMGAVGALLGPGLVLWACLYALLAAAVMGIVYALVACRARGASGPIDRYKGMIRSLWATGRVSYVRPGPGEAMAQPIPLAVPIAIGGTIAALLPL